MSLNLAPPSAKVFIGVLRHNQLSLAEQERGGTSENFSLLVLLDEDGEVLRVSDEILFLLNGWREVSGSATFCCCLVLE